MYLPEQDVRLAGYSALIHAYQLQVPLPRILAAISHKTTNYEKDRWKMFSPRYLPKCTLFAHITFALKYEGVDLFILKALFSVISTEEIIRIVKLEPTSAYSRRIWFLYEWLLNIKIDLPDAITGNFVNVLDERLQFPGPVRMSRRHRVRNNLPGVPGFCPIIYKTNKISKFLEMNLSEHVKKLIGQIHKDVLMRAAAFMLLKDSKASFAIEGETPSPTRAERWAQTIGQAAFYPLSHEEFLRLQELIIADFRFVHYGYRNEGGFIGEHERGSGLPIPDHISARYQDIMSLMNSLIQTNQLLKESDIDPVVAAAVISFGFVFIHPY
ncbi:MAG: Fic family protein [Gammaproteobacteria bacterium]